MLKFPLYELDTACLNCATNHGQSLTYHSINPLLLVFLSPTRCFGRLCNVAEVGMSVS